jgi:hypothetical protein
LVEPHVDGSLTDLELFAGMVGGTFNIEALGDMWVDVLLLLCSAYTHLFAAALVK